MVYGRGSRVFELAPDGTRKSYDALQGGGEPFRFALAFHHYDPGALQTGSLFYVCFFTWVLA